MKAWIIAIATVALVATFAAQGAAKSVMNSKEAGLNRIQAAELAANR
jgi:hypothetical protein